MLTTLQFKSDRGVVLPLILAGAAAVILSVYVLFIAARESDSIVAEQQETLVYKVIGKQLPDLTRNQKSVTVWDDAIRNAKDSFNPEWLDSNMGAWVHDFFAIDRSFILDDRDKSIYAMVDGKRAEPTAFADIAAAVDPLIRQLRAAAPYPEPSGDDVAHASRLVTVAGRPALVSVMPILSDSGKIVQQPGSEYLYVVLRYVDGGFLAGTLRDYAIQHPRFVWSQPQNVAEAFAPIRNTDDTVFGYAVWTPFRPGWSLLQRTAPALLGSILVLFGVIALLAKRLMRSSAEARHLALHDPLSNLANRALFNQAFDRALSARKTDGCVALLYMDLDRFKDVNDTLGHPAGDELIRVLALRLSNAVGGGDCVARLGGDEFGIVISDRRREFDVEQICRNVIAAVAEPFRLSGNEAFIGVSIGVAVAPRDGTSREDLMRKADLALYRAKRQGRNRFMFFEPDWDHSEMQWRQIEEEVRRAPGARKVVGLPS